MSENANPAPGVRQISTHSLAAKDRFDFWRSLFGGIEMRREGEVDRPFRAEATLCAGPRGTYFNHLRVDPLGNRYRAGPSDGAFLLTRVLEGRVELSEGDDASVFAPGELVLSDTSRSTQARHGRYAIGYLKLPRPLVVEALGGDPIPARGGFLRLANEGLAPFLSAQLALLAEHATALDPSERTVVLDGLVDLGLGLLRKQLRGRPSEGAADPGLFTSAKLYIERHSHRPELSPERVAAAVGCSRAQLYRQFAERELAVFEVIRETRLRRSCEQLKAHPLQPITAIALECGFADLSTFNRAFRRRFGLSPSEWRTRSTEAPETAGQVPMRRNA